MNRDEARAIAAARQSEAEFQAEVVDAALKLGWLCYHTLRSKGSEPGYPDLCLVRRDRLVYVELKAQGGQPTIEQQTWLGALARAGAETHIFRPADWDAIEAILR